MPERPKQTRTARKGEKPAEADVLEFVVAAVGAGDESDQALSHFFGGLSVSPGLAIILVQGGGPALDEGLHGLAISAGLSVDLITDGMTVEVNHLYVAPPGTASNSPTRPI